MRDERSAGYTSRSTKASFYGFYITPFETKAVKAKGRGAASEVTLHVDFGKVIEKVTEFFASHHETLGGIEYSFRINTAADQVRARYLDESIQRSIDEADFLVVDWTGLNQNVLIEAGYGKGRAKPGIHLSADGNIPTDRAGIIYISYHPEDLDQLARKLAPFIPQLINRIENSPRVFDYYDQRSTELVSRMIRAAQNEICILQTNLETVNANHLDDLWEAVQRGVRVRVLTLDPESRYVNERALQLGYPTRETKVYRQSLQTAIDNAVSRLRIPGFSLRLYNDFPNQLTFIFDDYILASVISRTGRSRNNCCFVLPSGHLQGARHTFIDHFEQLWENADQEIRGEQDGQGPWRGGTS